MVTVAHSNSKHDTSRGYRQHRPKVKYSPRGNQAAEARFAAQLNLTAAGAVWTVCERLDTSSFLEQDPQPSRHQPLVRTQDR